MPYEQKAPSPADTVERIRGITRQQADGAMTESEAYRQILQALDESVFAQTFHPNKDGGL